VKVSIRHLILVTGLLVVFALPLNAQDSGALQAIRSGNGLVAQGRYELAIKEFENVTAREGDAYARATYNIGVCYFELYLTDNALAFFERAIELKRGNYPRASYALGVGLEEQNRLSEAADAYKQAMQSSHGEYAAATFRLGVIAAKNRQIEKAAGFFRDASKHRGPHVPNSLNNLGVMLVQMGQLDEAEKQFANALRQTDGSFGEAEHNLQLCRSLLVSAANRKLFVDLKLASTDLRGDR
jgi:tetratricopeptide (TPR) repeat protein